jgi:hypothetical protein
MHPIHILDLRHTPATIPRWLGALCYAATAETHGRLQEANR